MKFPRRSGKAFSLSMSAVAFVTLAYLETVPAHADTGQLADQLAELHQEVDPTPLLAPVVGRVMLANASTQQTQTQSQTQVLPTPGVLVPDLQGMRLPAARRQMRKLGLKLVVRDESNYPVQWQESRFYNVRRQSAAAGEQLEPGSWVRLQVRERGSVASGY